MSRLKNKSGFTFAEMLVVVAIIVILSGVSVVAVQKYERSLGQLERDEIAKEIFVAAQNNLSAAYGAGYYGLKETSDPNPFGVKNSEGNYYFAVNRGTVTPLSATSIFSQMLPYGSIDDTIRTGDSYIIVYQKDTGLVLDVYYCSNNGPNRAFNYNGLDKDKYNAVASLKGSDNKLNRRNFTAGNDSILGWYGWEHETPPITDVVQLTIPTINVVNKEKLYVEIYDPNYSINVSTTNGSTVNYEKLGIKLYVTGVTSGAQIVYDLKATNDRVKKNTASGQYYVLLDDITKDGMHFANIASGNGYHLMQEKILKFRLLHLELQP